jgi:hypothetical protein
LKIRYLVNYSLRLKKNDAIGCMLVNDMARNLGTLLMNWKVITMVALTGIAAVEKIALPGRL